MKIIVGVDGSEPSERAVEWCARYAKALDAEVVAVHAIDIPVIVAPATMAFPLPQFTPQDREKLRELATDEWCTHLAKEAVPFRVLVVDGDPAFAIMKAATDEKADLVVTGRRGRGGFAELLLGSTSHALSHHLKIPLVIIP